MDSVTQQQTQTDPLYCQVGTKARRGTSEGRAVCGAVLPDPCASSLLVHDTTEAKRNFSAISMCSFGLRDLGWRPNEDVNTKGQQKH